MSQLNRPTDVRYFCSCLYKESIDVSVVLGQKFQIIEAFEPSFNPLSEYYSKEMGTDLKRTIFFFDEVSRRENLVGYKLWADRIERETSVEGRRTINIDVGYIAKEQVLLATGKPYSHRIYLSDGVFAELVYTYSDKTFKSLSWTYPDYQAEEKISVFKRFRP